MIVIFYVQTCLEVSIRKYELLTGNIFSKYVLKIMNVKSKAGCVTFWMDTWKLKSKSLVDNQFKKKDH